MKDNNIRYKIKEKEKGKGINRIYFSCHPDDFDEWFEVITDEILEVADCSIYYLEDQNYYPDSKEEIDDYSADLSQFSLFVFPITVDNYLKKSSRAKEIDFAIALQQQAKVLPILVDGTLDWNNLPKELSKKQILDRTKDISMYKDRLKVYLQSVLVDGNTYKKIQDAFDAYIFLSYRKKDRKFVNQVMSTIHHDESMRDVAIWWDDFLTPGEDFNAEISKYIDKSKLMALLVTPNINEYQDGQGNYVIRIEYPEAIKKGKEVLPIEADKTNKEELKQNFIGIKDPIDKDNYVEIDESLKKLLFSEGIKENNDPEHLYYIALAYLNGIDVEKNFRKGFECLKKSADNGYLQSKKLMITILEENQFLEYALPYQIDLVNNDEYMKHADEFIEKLRLVNMYRTSDWIKIFETLKSLDDSIDMTQQDAIVKKLKVNYLIAKFHSKNNEDIPEIITNIDKFDQDIKVYESLLEDEEAIQYLPKYAILFNNVVEYWGNIKRDATKALEYCEKELSYVLKWFEYNNHKLGIASYDQFKKEFEIHQKEWDKDDWQWQCFGKKSKIGSIRMDPSLGAFGYWDNFIYIWFMQDKNRQLSSDERKTVLNLLDICSSLGRIYDWCLAFSDDQVKKDYYQKMLHRNSYHIDVLKTIIRVVDSKNNNSKTVNTRSNNFKDNINFHNYMLIYDILNVIDKLDSKDGYDTIKYLLEFYTVHNAKEDAIKLFEDYSKYLEGKNKCSAWVISTLEQFVDHLCELNAIQEAINAFKMLGRIAAKNNIHRPRMKVKAYQQIKDYMEKKK